MNTAMILAAGRGERLRPFTDTTPKALCEVSGKTLIQWHLEKLKAAGFTRIVINHAHLGGQIRTHVGLGSPGFQIHYSPEPPGGLETGGGIVQALPLLGDNPFLMVNADIFTDCDFQGLQLPEGSGAHLVLVKNPPHNLRGDFSITQENQLCITNPAYTFSGIALYHPRDFLAWAHGRFPLKPVFDHLISQKKLSGQVFNGLWMDIGTPERLSQAQRKGALLHAER